MTAAAYLLVAVVTWTHPCSASAKERPDVTADEEGPSAADLYWTVRLIRRFEERAIELVRAGQVASGIHPCIGQEAVAAGIGAALRRDDILLTSHRGHGHNLAKGSDPGRLLAEVLGRATGVACGRGGPRPSRRAA